MTICLSILGLAAIAWAVVMLALIGLVYWLLLSREADRRKRPH
jgi:ABC-type siderophore export system fused ATPase/permease subunit